MKLIKRKEIFWVDFRDPQGTRRRISTGETEQQKAALRAADIVRASMAAQCASEGTTARTLGQQLAKHYADHWASKKSATVMKHTVAVVAREIGYWPLNEITYARLKDYCDGLIRDGKKPATANRRMSAVSSCMREAKRREEIKQLPDFPSYKENNRKDRYVSLAEEAAYMSEIAKRAQIDALRGRDEWVYMGALAVFLIDTGFRFSEAFKFTVVGNLACLGGDTKNDSPRRIPMTDRAREAAAIMQAHRWHLNGWNVEQRWSWASHRWGSLMQASGTVGVTLHILRHTCASRLVQRGVNLYVVKDWLGHKSIRTTERYAHLAPDSMMGALAALEGKPQAEPSSDVKSLHGTRQSQARLQST